MTTEEYNLEITGSFIYFEANLNRDYKEDDEIRGRINLANKSCYSTFPNLKFKWPQKCVIVWLSNLHYEKGFWKGTNVFARKIFW